jgi:hypothetical protein
MVVNDLALVPFLPTLSRKLSYKLPPTLNHYLLRITDIVYFTYVQHRLLHISTSPSSVNSSWFLPLPTPALRQSLSVMVLDYHHKATLQSFPLCARVVVRAVLRHGVEVHDDMLPRAPRHWEWLQQPEFPVSHGTPFALPSSTYVAAVLSK